MTTAGWSPRRVLVWLKAALLLLPAVASLAVLRRRDLVVLAAGGPHVDNLVGVLSSAPVPAGLRVVIVASAAHRRDPALAHAAAAADARVVGRASPRAAWAIARAGWILLPGHRSDAWQMLLGRARLVYVNHGPWLKSMPPAPPQGWTTRWFRRLFGRYRFVLASTPDEVADYRAWKTGAEVLDLGYPRSAVLDAQVAAGLQPHKVALLPTWKEFPDPSYGGDLAARLHDRLVAAGMAEACVEYRPHPVTPDEPRVVGQDDGRPPALVVTDFSSVAFDQAYRGGAVLLYSQRLEEYLAVHGVRPALEAWLRRHVVSDPDELARRVVEVLAGRSRGVPAAAKLRPFDGAAFWRRLMP